MPAPEAARDFSTLEPDVMGRGHDLQRSRVRARTPALRSKPERALGALRIDRQVRRLLSRRRPAAQPRPSITGKKRWRSSWETGAFYRMPSGPLSISLVVETMGLPRSSSTRYLRNGAYSGARLTAPPRCGAVQESLSAERAGRERGNARARREARRVRSSARALDY